ncbi:MAG: hypothetical protein ACLUEU_01745 [Oscillospiraceae bacterium]
MSCVSTPLAVALELEVQTKKGVLDESFLKLPAWTQVFVIGVSSAYLIGNSMYSLSPTICSRSIHIGSSCGMEISRPVYHKIFLSGFGAAFAPFQTSLAQ